MSSLSQKQTIKPHWWGKTIAGVVLGLGLSFALVGLFAWLGSDSLPQEISNERLLWRSQFLMWMITPIWLLILSLVYLFTTAQRAVIWLGSANIIAYAALFMAKGGL